MAEKFTAARRKQADMLAMASDTVLDGQIPMEACLLSIVRERDTFRCTQAYICNGVTIRASLG